MIQFYPHIRLLHMTAAFLSGGLFALRGASALAGMRWPLAAPVRYFSYTVDTVLLTAALMLVTMLPDGFFASGWLAMKIPLVLLYIVLGVFALKRGRTRRSRGLFLVCALLVYGQIYGVARTHHPLGWLLYVGPA
ncbi:MAG: SirB2 family protein [Xanthomonadaceae bacterium]|jgi:uncharacterized membrane protein SirB2|nr:SirB2 family protein [Xanthomonadaceae bacterium]